MSQYGPQTATDGGLREALLSSYVFLAISIQMHLEQISLLFGQIGKRYNFSQQAVISRVRVSPGSVSRRLQCLRMPRVDSPASACLPIRSLLINPGRIDIILAQPLTKTPGRESMCLNRRGCPSRLGCPGPVLPTRSSYASPGNRRRTSSRPSRLEKSLSRVEHAAASARPDFHRALLIRQSENLLILLCHSNL